MPSVRVIVVGAASFAEEVADMAATCGYEVVAMIEGLDRTIVDRSHVPPIIWADDQAAFEPALEILPAIGSVRRMDLCLRLVREGRRLATLVHPSAVISPSARIQAGSIVGPLVVVAAHSRIGEGVILNRGSLIGHHTEIGRYSTISPGANVGGKVTIGEQVYVGMGAAIRDHLRVGDRSVVGMGAVAVKDVPPDVTVVGVPAAPLQPHP